MARKKHKSNRSYNESNWQTFDFDDEPSLKHGGPNIRLYDKFKPKTDGQKTAFNEVRDNRLSFIGGSVGTGKTHVAIAAAAEALYKGQVKKIYIARPTVTAGKDLGHLPGDLKEKIDPYLVPIYDCLEYYLSKDQMKKLIEDEIINIVAIQYLRGRTLSDAFIIIDEAQNATKEQLKLVIGRIGEGSSMAICYDVEQIDLRPKTDSCVSHIQEFKGRVNFGFHEFGPEDIIRSEIVKAAMAVYKEIEDRGL